MHQNRYGHMVHEYTVGRVREILQERAERLAAVQTRAEAQAYVDDVRAKAARCFPALPARTDLKARTTGTSDLGDIRLEKVVYESRPGFLVSANLYLPARIDAELPCVLGLCGHSENGKAYGPYQFFARGLASKGFAVLIVDPVSQGERRQFYTEEGVPAGESGPRSTVAHNMIGNRMLLTGDSVGSWFAWDAIRGLDYLLARPEADTSRVGVTGCSGGGTQTTQVTALDPRITMAAPDCFITSWLCNLENELPADAEQNPPRALEFGLDEADLLLAYAPRPTMILAEENCYFDLRGARQAHVEMKKIHSLLGSPDSVEISVGPLDHGFHKHAREAMYGFFIKHGGLDVECQEPPMEAIADAQLNAAEGEVVPFGGKKIFGFTQARAKELITRRPRLEYPALQDAARRLLQIQVPDSPPHFRYLRRNGGQDCRNRQGLSVRGRERSGHPGHSDHVRRPGKPVPPAAGARLSIRRPSFQRRGLRHAALAATVSNRGATHSRRRSARHRPELPRLLRFQRPARTVWSRLSLRQLRQHDGRELSWTPRPGPAAHDRLPGGGRRRGTSYWPRRWLRAGRAGCSIARFPADM